MSPNNNNTIESYVVNEGGGQKSLKSCQLSLWIPPPKASYHRDQITYFKLKFGMKKHLYHHSEVFILVSG